MKNNKLTWLVAAAAAILLILIVVPSIVIAQSNDIGNMIGQISRCAYEKNWTDAAVLANTLHQQWDGQKRLISLNFAAQDYSDLGDAIGRVRAGILAEDRSLVISECEVAKKLLDNMLRVVPEP